MQVYLDTLQETEEETDKEIEKLNDFCFNDESNSDKQISLFLILMSFEV